SRVRGRPAEGHAQRRDDRSGVFEDSRGVHRGPVRLTTRSGLADPTPEWNLTLGMHQHDVAVSQYYAQREHFREEVRDLARREVDHRQYQLPHEIGLVVVLRYLRARALQAQLAEVDAQLVSGLARLGKVVDLHDAADADVDLGEVVVGDHCSASG